MPTDAETVRAIRALRQTEKDLLGKGRVFIEGFVSLCDDGLYVITEGEDPGPFSAEVKDFLIGEEEDYPITPEGKDFYAILEFDSGQECTCAVQCGRPDFGPSWYVSYFEFVEET